MRAMPENIFTCIVVYCIGVSLWAIGLTLYDKRAARLGKWRVKERTLLLASFMGGSAAMFVTMCVIRHKTRHVKFMIGIPVIIVLQAAIILFVWWQLKGGVL